MSAVDEFSVFPLLRMSLCAFILKDFFFFSLFYWILKSLLTVLFFWYLKNVTPLPSDLHGF